MKVDQYNGKSQLICDLFAQKCIGNNIKRIVFHETKLFSGGSSSEIACATFEDGSSIELFLKICRTGSITEKLNSELLIFDKEICFYNEILPILIDFQHARISKNSVTVPIDSLFFRSYGFGSISQDIYIVLEKLNDSKYTVSKVEEFHGVDQIHCAMKNIAHFHAASYCMKTIQNFDFLDRYPILEEKLFHPKSRECASSSFIGNYKTNLKVLKAICDEMKADNEIVEKYSAFCKNIKYPSLKRFENLADEIMDIFYEICCEKNAMSVVCHGDFHMWNIAFDNEDVSNLKLFDLQLIHYASALLDIHQYIHQVSTPQIRQQHLKDFLQTYCSNFKLACNEYGLESHLNTFTVDCIFKEYQHTSPWGFLYGFIFLLYRFIDKDIYSTLSQIENSNEIVNLLNVNDKVWDIIKVYIDLISEAENGGTINIMEELVVNARSKRST